MDTKARLNATRARAVPRLAPRFWLAFGVLAIGAALAVLRPAAAQDAQVSQDPLATAEELRELVGPIALYPDDLIAIVRGKKRFYVLPPEQRRNLDPYPMLSSVPHLARLDPEASDPSVHGRAGHVRGFSCELEAGDVLSRWARSVSRLLAAGHVLSRLLAAGHVLSRLGAVGAPPARGR